MKKAIYICAAAAMALASCSNDETVELAKGNGINFRSVAGLNTRAVNLTQNELEKKGMYVTTFSENGDRVYPETHYELDNSVWVAHPAQSWGAYTTLNFVLTSPKLSEWDSTFELTKEAEDILVTVDEEIPDQKDYMAVRLKGVSKTDSSIPVSLKHMFSSVEIRAKNTNGAYRYKVKGIRLCGVGRKAYVNFYMATSLFHGIVDTRTFELTYATPVTLGSDAQSLMGDATNAILPPQPTFGYATPELAQKWAFESPADPRSTYISVLINLTSKYGASIYPEGSTADNETYGWVAIPVPYEWEGGNKYIYTLDFSEGAGRVDPDDPGDAVDAGGKDPAKAQPVLGSRITFSVAVSPWGDVNKDIPLGSGTKFTVGVDSWTDTVKDAELN